jgi:hypothetical protein
MILYVQWRPPERRALFATNDFEALIYRNFFTNAGAAEFELRGRDRLAPGLFAGMASEVGLAGQSPC